ncbi:MAG TPA: hypothetical protein VF668_06050 [Pyrinomonadaceae bacterium]|jgi:hypothetical protein
MGRGVARSRAAAGLLLLVVTAHAFVASATHFHRVATPGGQPARAAVLGRDGAGQSAPLAGDDTQCLLCRLQRNLVSELNGAAHAVAPPPAEALGRVLFRNASALASRSLRPSGRAPPAA